jgi:hypothetical protein
MARMFTVVEFETNKNLHFFVVFFFFFFFFDSIFIFVDGSFAERPLAACQIERDSVAKTVSCASSSSCSIPKLWVDARRSSLGHVGALARTPSPTGARSGVSRVAADAKKNE